MTKLTTSSSAPSTLLVMAGGTGGHIFPGIAVAEYLAKQHWHIHWLGTAERMEAEIIPKQGYDISFINIAGVRKNGLKSLLLMPFKVVNAVWQSIKVLKQVKPDVVLGMGGYASAPGGIAAWLLGIPLVLHEQNAVAGMTNKILAKFATKTLSAFPNAFKAKVKTQVIGNPVRTDIIAIADEAKGQREHRELATKNILIVGGSLGAKVLNDIVPLAIAKLQDETVNVWHQTGANNQQGVLASYQPLEHLNKQIKVTEFIDDMASAYQWADLVICRAGALTVSELAMAGKAAIFVPLPHAVDDHQTKNAGYLVACGAAKLIKQHNFNEETVAQQLAQLFNDNTAIAKMSQAAKAAAKPNATEDVAMICAELAAR